MLAIKIIKVSNAGKGGNRTNCCGGVGGKDGAC